MRLCVCMCVSERDVCGCVRDLYLRPWIAVIVCYIWIKIDFIFSVFFCQLVIVKCLFVYLSDCVSAFFSLWVPLVWMDSIFLWDHLSRAEDTNCHPYFTWLILLNPSIFILHLWLLNLPNPFPLPIHHTRRVFSHVCVYTCIYIPINVHVQYNRAICTTVALRPPTLLWMRASWVPCPRGRSPPTWPWIRRTRSSAT